MVSPLRIALAALALSALFQPGAAPAAHRHESGDCMRSCCMHERGHESRGGESCAMACEMSGHNMHGAAGGDRCGCAMSAAGTTPEASVTPVIVHEAPLASMLALRGAFADPRTRAARPEFDSPHASFEPDLTDPPPRA
jgi:hypothetical protein